MPELSICMPSNRNFAASREAIKTALAYCEERDALLIVSDNSEDAEKKAYWKGRSPRLTYFDNPGISGLDNTMTVLDAVTTPFLLSMGDDDFLFNDRNEAPFDLATLPYDYIGVMPVSEVYSEGHGIIQIKTLSLEQDEPIDRINGYIGAAQGNNSFYYSIFRREVFLPMVNFFFTAHPTKGGYADWALALTMASYGKFQKDPSTIFRYNAGNWNSSQKIADSSLALYRNAGLPDEAMIYERLFMFLDLFILTARVGSPLSQAKRQKLGGDVVSRMLTMFITEMSEAPEKFDGTVRYLATMALDEKDAFTQFQIGLMMADRVQPGLKDRYVAFLKESMGVTE